MSWPHPILGIILAMVRRGQPEHVWKHLYNPEERWQDLCLADVRELYQAAIDEGCPPYHASECPQRFHWRVERVLQRHHDAAYGPAYGSEIASPDARWGQKLADPSRWVARTPRAVVAFVATSPETRVKTAFRPLPPIPHVGWDDEDFQRQADYKFEKETGMVPVEPANLARDLAEAAGVAVVGVREAWWLALAVGRGRTLVLAQPSLADPLAAAERALGRIPHAVIAEVSLGLIAGHLLDRLADALKQDEPEAAEESLSDLEDTLLVLSALGRGADAEAMLGEATELLAWLPREFDALARQAVLRQAALGSAGPATELWANVEESFVGAQLRATNPVSRPRSSLVDSLIPAPVLLDRFAASLSKGSGSTRAWVQAQLAGLRVRQPVPVMGKAVPEQQAWLVEGDIRVGPGTPRVFVVDDAYPNGYDVTDLAMAPNAALWELEQPGQSATVVLVAAPSALHGASLAELLEAAAVRDDVVILDRLLTRPR